MNQQPLFDGELASLRTIRDMYLKFRHNLCATLGLSEAVSNWEIEEAVVSIYKTVKKP